MMKRGKQPEITSMRNRRNQFAGDTNSTIRRFQSSANCWQKIQMGCSWIAMSFPVFYVILIARIEQVIERNIWKCGTAKASSHTSESGAARERFHQTPRRSSESAA